MYHTAPGLICISCSKFWTPGCYRVFSSRAGLHTRAIILARKLLMIGSYNVDRRSTDLNSELALLIDSSAFAEKVKAYLDEGATPQESYRLELADGEMHRMTDNNCEYLNKSHYPETSWWDRRFVGLLALFPIESQLYQAKSSDLFPQCIQLEG